MCRPVTWKEHSRASKVGPSQRKGNHVPASIIAAPEALVDRARQQTGLSDYGADGWQEGLQRFLAAVPGDIGLDAIAASVIERTAVGRLVNRLRIEQWCAEHADAAAHGVDGPLLIVGLPRTATTALHHLLSVDTQFRYQRRWELLDPVPPPEVATESEDPRRLETKATAITHHISTVDGPIEDGPALGLNFGHQELGLPLPTYTRWWRTSDMTTTYAYHERVLRLLHSRRPPYRWLLKAPSYCFHLSYIAAQYPNARFLWTHRDPVVAIPSTCSVVRNAQELVVPSHRSDPNELGAFILEHFVESMRLATAARETLGEDRFCDIHQQDVEVRPIETVERIYEFTGLELNDKVRSAMETWTVENRRGSLGEHEYTPEMYGLTANGIREAFRDYVERFSAAAS